MNITLGITIATYQRPDGKTPYYLERALTHLCNQTYQDFRLFVVGDKYENDDEFESILNSFDSLRHKITCVNLPYAKERDKYFGINNTILWNCGGANAFNYATFLATQNGITKICALDHDDYWLPNHLELIAKTIVEKNHPAFIYTLSKYINREVFPHVEITDGQAVENYPAYGYLAHSATCIDFKQLPFKYRDIWEEEGRIFPSDGDMWERIRHKCDKENLRSYIIREVTCVHEMEGAK